MLTTVREQANAGIEDVFFIEVGRESKARR
jgi:hypothetical protein